MVSRITHLAIFVSLASVARANSFWAGWNGSDGNPWQWPGPDISAPYWVGQTEDAIATMQHTFWNGTYWPTIQWVGAVVDTILAATDDTLTDALAYTERNTSAQSTTASVHITAEIETYFSENEIYYGSEHASEIFNEAYDDVQWVVLEWLQTIKFIERFDNISSSVLANSTDDIVQYAHRAHIFYNIVQDKFDTSQCDGGLTWNPTLLTYKNAITNTLFISTSIGMYLYWPGDDNNTDPYPDSTYQQQTNTTLPPLPVLAVHDPLLLENAKMEYAWFASHNFTNVQGLIVDGFHISSGQTSCDQRNEMVYTYNQGAILSGLRGLWEATGDTSYLNDAYSLINTVINATGWNALDATAAATWSGLGRNGIMEDYCDAAGDCDQDDLIFKGVYFQHLSHFCAPLPTSAPLIPNLTYVASQSVADAHTQNCETRYAPWIMHNAHAALSTRNSTDIIGEWWGASYLNQTNGPVSASNASQYAVPLPLGSIDIANQPWLLTQYPWSSSAQYDTKSAATSADRRKRDDDSSVQVYSVETEAQGLSVVKAAADLALGYQ